MKYYICISDTKVNMLYEQLGLQTHSPQERIISLRDKVKSHFKKSELRDLCLELGVDYEDLPGERKSDKVRELILFCKHRGEMSSLVHRCQI